MAGREARWLLPLLTLGLLCCAPIYVVGNVVASIGCEGDRVVVDCTSAQKCEGSQDCVIEIVSGSYDRRNPRTCRVIERPASEYSRCTSNSALPIIRERCNGLPACTLPVSAEVFGDPCPGVVEYMTVTYKCIPATVDIGFGNPEANPTAVAADVAIDATEVVDPGFGNPDGSTSRGPGNSANAPGRSTSVSGRPGNSGNAPGHNKRSTVVPAGPSLGSDKTASSQSATSEMTNPTVSTTENVLGSIATIKDGRTRLTTRSASATTKESSTQRPVQSRQTASTTQSTTEKPVGPSTTLTEQRVGPSTTLERGRRTTNPVPSTTKGNSTTPETEGKATSKKKKVPTATLR